MPRPTPPRCVILSQLFHPETVSTGTLLTELAEGLAARGLEVKVIAGQPTYYDFGRTRLRIEHNGVTIERPACSTWFRKDSLPGRLLNIATYVGGTFWHLLWRREKGPLLIVTTPPFLPMVGYLANRLWRARYVVLIHDVYPDVLPHFGLAKADGWIVRLWHRLNRRIYGHADRIIVLGRHMATIMAEKDPRPDPLSRIDVIPNWQDPALIVPRDKRDSPFLREAGIDADFVLQYSGNFGRLHNVEILVEAMADLDDPRTHLMFVGGGQKKATVERMVREKGLTRVSLHPFQPQERLGESLTACDVQVAVLDEPFTGLAVPCKLYGMLASGKPLLVVCDRRGEMGRVVEEEQCGLVVEPNDLEGLVEAIRFLRDHAEQREAMGRRARQAFESKYTLPHILDQYVACLQKVQPTA